TASGIGQQPGGRFKSYLGTLLQNDPFLVEFSSDVSPTSVFSGAAPGPGDLWLAFEDFSLGSPSVQSWEYTVGIQVEASASQPVPEPATVALVGAALLAMTGLSTTRRRKGA
nr:PEP-CTERM sorting domain-containing protein [Rubrivivax sp.]